MNNLARLIRERWLVISASIVMVIWIVFLLVRYSEATNDMVYFVEKVSNTSLIDFLRSQYEITPRTILEAFLYVIVKIPYFIFVILTVAFIFMMIWSLRYILKWNNLSTAIAILMVVLFPYKILHEAGTQNSVINYIWSLSFAVVSFIPIRMVWDGKKIKWYHYLVFALAALIACNMEQVAAITAGFLVLFIALAIKEKKLHPILLIQLVICLLSLAYLGLGPANAHRTEVSILAYWIGFEELSVIDKLWNVYYISLDYYFARPLLVLDVFAAGITIKLVLDRKIIPAICTGISTIWLMLMVALRIVNIELLNRINAAVYYMDDRNGSTLANPDMKMVVVLSVLLGMIIVGYCFTELESGKKKLISIILLAGVCSRAMMGFSPTLIASQFRTSAYCNIAIMIASVEIWTIILSRFFKKLK